MPKRHNLQEASYANKEGNELLFKTPMFTVLIDKKYSGIYTHRQLKSLENILKESRIKIHNMGFPSMHSYIIVRDLSGDGNEITGVTGKTGELTNAGQAHRYTQRIDMDVLYIKKYIKNHFDMIIETIVHEWAHLWMFQRSKQFKTSVWQVYNKMLASARDTIRQNSADYKEGDNVSFGDFYKQSQTDDKLISKSITRKFLSTPEGSAMRDLVSSVENLPSAYGMADYEEFWATSLECFDSLPLTYRKKIISLMV